MKKVDLNKLFAGLTKKFRVNTFKTGYLLKPNESSPYDVTIDAYGTRIKSKDVSKIDKLVKKCITGKIIGYLVKVEGNKIHIYIEIKESKLGY